ncbi:conserved Plasmodium protein, unknown function [Plasmodium vivax]|uniref:Uncharacterized protein n=6 Tax=Plasmodium vivax TaxID=5855 RepID=A5K9A1_PLAVS|nr:hypothetical protein, conserved [Plasmodium vivax]KMZ80114.1 hypothetical protein PVIIG_01894 [Plasmodium vivax India VII]KMZ86200.1 hypothetical protein PVBG_01724 [Plasmodium vivax Brazil I]KMZ92561.1 hypothetical protein PVMG_01149 [Plasmodium vivax Mauritania I]KMZ99111.1 hypothetical protein PVNG_00801 [Plasmodium vivax North Korean]EDL43973.1 hypothetical protein, conserved [Plasmodium vivax]|eukprot:XP_001613700.1 hypothetical protein [Plasmodium vivax Sal-1]
MLLLSCLLFLSFGLKFIFAFKSSTPLLPSLFLNASLSLQVNGHNGVCKNKRNFSLYGVPKKKSSHRRTRRRKVAWMKKNPAKLYRTSSYDMDEIMRYTDRKLTAHYTTRDSWLNLPPTTLINDFFLFREIRS